MVSSDVWDEATAESYDTDSAHKFAPEVLGPAVELLTRLAGAGPVLEFAIGTGRVAIPLAARGLDVQGIELSQPMVAQLRRKADEAAIPVTVGDMATMHVPGAFSLVYLVWNSLSNLRTQDEQVACFRNAARHLAPGGRFVIELSVPQLRRMSPGQLAAPIVVTDQHLLFDTYDLVAQACTSHHYRQNPDGSTRYSYGNFRYAWPAECDLMAHLAGMELESRAADWSGGVFDSDSGSHVSVWRKPDIDAG